jgi:hypothetical protein
VAPERGTLGQPIRARNAPPSLSSRPNTASGDGSAYDPSPGRRESR